MTKHLRLIMLSLLAMICMGGYSQSEVIIWQEDWTGAKKDNKVNVVSENYSSTGDATKIYEENLAGLKSPELLINGSFTVTINNLQGCQGELKLSFKTNKGKGNLSITANGTNIKVPTFDEAKKERITTLNVPQNAESLVIKFNNSSGNRRFDDFKLTKVISGKDDSGIKFKEAAKEVELNTVKLSLSDLITNPHNLPIKYSTSDKETAEELDGTLLLYKTGKVTVTASFEGDDTYAATSTSMELTIVDNRQDAGIHFAKDSYAADITGGTFNEAVLVKPEGINKVKYTISPKSEGVSIAEDGTVTYPAVDATYTVTAEFNGDDTYKPATATYTLNVVDPNIKTRTIGFEAGMDKGNKGISDSYTEGDIIEKDGISVNCDKARLGCTSKEGYRIYKDGLLTISTKIGDITKITFDDLGTADDLPNNLEPESGNYDKVNYVWTGKGKSIRFKVNVKAFLSKITVTVKVPVAKDYTLDENSVNTIEAYENANVTLKRTFYKDGEWNTLCLPFAVADAKTAFDGAELREVDTQNSHDNTIVFKKATAIEAGKPYLIKWANSSSAAVNVEKKFEGVTLVAAATPVVVKEGGISFNGFYKMTEASELGASVAAIGAGNKLFKVTEGKMKGFRAAFVLKSNTPASVIKLVIDGTATGIEDLVIDGVKANGRVYNLNGQYVGNSLNGLQPGLYIQNGKKIVVK